MRYKKAVIFCLCVLDPNLTYADLPTLDKKLGLLPG